MHEIVDFGRSYVSWVLPPDPTDKRKPGHMPWGNSVRIQIDAICSIEEKTTGQSDTFYLIAPCRKEWMYREEEIIQSPNGEYRMIFALDRQLDVGKDMVERGDRPRSVTTDTFTSLSFEISHVPAQRLETDQDVVKASQGRFPIVVESTMQDTSGQITAHLSFPVKTMNFHPERERFQVDTGPLIFPDLAISPAHLIDRCKLAHVVFNTSQYAEFICKTPTTSADGESIFHYSDVHRVQLQNHLYEASAFIAS